MLLLLAAIYLNGVNVEGLRGQTFEKCKSVRIDDKGDVHLQCPGYHVEATTAPPVAAATAVPAVATKGSAITKHYWLVTEAQGGDAQYEIDVFVNSRWLRRIKSTDDQIVLDITKSISPGANTVLLSATKRLEAGRKTTAASAFVKVIIGEGEAAGGNVLIDNPLVELKRSGAESDSVNEEFTIQGR